MPPAIVARMAVDDRFASRGGRFGVNIVTGWQQAEYSQMGLWPGDEHFGKRYDYSPNTCGSCGTCGRPATSDFKGEYFQMDECRVAAAAGADEDRLRRAVRRGHGVRRDLCRLHLRLGKGVNTPTAFAPSATSG